MIDSGASGMGFVDPAFVKRCGATTQPSSRRIVLADGSEVQATGEATLSYLLDARTCHLKGDTPPVQFTSTFIVTPLAPYDLILGIGWLQRHHVLIGFNEKSIQLRVDGNGKQHCIRPLARCNDDGSDAAEAAPLQLKTITGRSVGKMLRSRKREFADLFAVLIKPADEPGGAAKADSIEKVPPGADNPRVKAILEKYKNTVLGEPKPGVPRKRGVEHAIQLVPGAVPPPARPLFHQSAKDAEVMREYVEAGLRSGTLIPSTSPYGSMALIVKKKDGTPRVVIDYRALNEVTIKNKYPLPLMDELFDRTVGARFFTSIDLRNGFLQIAIRPEDREKTAFRTRFGHFEYTVLPMGLCNAPGTFMQLMNQLFADMLDKSVLCFLDDILIYSRTEEEHLKSLETVLARLKEQELYVKPSKCAFMQTEVSFLGHRIGADGLRVAPDKISTVQNWPQPKNVTEVRSFTGLANFYRRFVKDYSRIALPLTELTKDTVPWKWGAEQQGAFDELKRALCSPPVLLIADQTKPFTLNTDACNYAIGATLQQDQGNGLQPVAYFSAKMSDAERRYDVREKEFMALFRACMHWRHYLHGLEPFLLLTDHDSLKYHKTMPNMSDRIARWIEKMAQFTYKLAHIPGKDNIVADALSRRADYAPPAPSFATRNPYQALSESGEAAVATTLAAARVARAPEAPEVRQRSIDAATKVRPADAAAPAPNKKGTIMTPSQRCTADTKAGSQCGQRTAMGHLCWNHLKRDVGVRVKKSPIPGAGKGLFAARPEGLPKGTSLPYTGDDIVLDDDGKGGPYVLQTRNGRGIDAARRNAGVARWVNDPRGGKDETGRQLRANCEFVPYTPPGSTERFATVRTLRPIANGEELLVAYGSGYWRIHIPTGRKQMAGATKQPPARRQQARQGPPAAAAQQLADRQRDRQFESIMMLTLHSAEGSEPAARNLRQTAARRAAASESAQNRSSARAGRAGDNDVAAAPAAAPAEPNQPEPDQGPSTETLIAALRRAAAADKAYQDWVQQPPLASKVERGLVFSDAGQIRVPADATLRTRIMAELHDSPTGAHCGRDRMLSEAQRRFTWDGMARDIEQYVATCDSCQRNKHSKQLKPGLLMPLPLPEEPCVHWTTDTVTGLPKTKQGYDAIQVYVDRRTKLKRFAATRKTDSSVQLANTTLRTIIGPHGMPRSIVSDRDPRITAKFWRELSRLLGSTVDMSTAYHPQSDGQSEREIQTLETALLGYGNAMGDDWDQFLPALELAFNSKKQASTGAAPFTLVYGTEARLPIDCALDEVRPTNVPAAADRAERMKTAMELARTQTERAQAKQKRLADRHRRLLQLTEGDQVLLATEDLRLRSGSHKMTARYIGPFRVIGTVNENAVKLDLPPLLGALHSTINISRLKLYRDGKALFPTRPQRLVQPPAVETDTNGVTRYAVEAVLAQRRKGSQREMLVRWVGYGAEQDEWRPRSELVKSAGELVAQFDALQQGGSSYALQLALNQLSLAGAVALPVQARPASPSPPALGDRSLAAVNAAKARFGVMGVMSSSWRSPPPATLKTSETEAVLSGEDVTGA
jgi:hypothetical protein